MTFYLPDDLVDRIDQVRGSTSRSEFARLALEGKFVRDRNEAQEKETAVSHFPAQVIAPTQSPVPVRQPSGNFWVDLLGGVADELEKGNRERAAREKATADLMKKNLFG